ncbi:hypothetical protein JIM95_010540 [Corynebacterium sp. CCM 8835]|uniref:Uncharacterized protein n=1 Tax=Corynebacterium antarcticum TaxID=2800405 RepID=A0A9Q4GNG2_9CORY|nr:hypothetical protein [Corynebacterium antarcticum]MCK7643267.1 hypothetical protein [Corynebacterium antarcticum]MCK7661771.1 hypothetical protein [Corynebacterium antarcticum]MCL0246570.1 hypothetical protein [Corynebacterium antarcticum]MCX7492711.1 hypothetical protein [Corynebacterium antarcticum]MCX7538796.1 hypothetical protein [Corynebacterium antarcticum]
MNRIFFSEDATRPLRAPDDPRVSLPELPPGSMTAAVLSRLVDSWSRVLGETSAEMTELRSGVRTLVSRLRESDASGAGDLDGIGHV